MRLFSTCLAIIASCVSSLPLAAEDFFFHDGDKVVMIGDSITEQHLYSSYVEMWVSTRFPAWKITFRNVGIGGDRSTGGNSRFKRDVLVHQPTNMTVDFGMNDGGYKPFDEAGFKTYMGGLQGMADQATEAKIRTAWVTPQPLDNADPGATALTAYNLTLEQYSAGVKTIAEKNGGVFVDQFHPYLAVLDKARSAGPKYDRITGGDAVHPGPPGQALMAASILKGLNFPALVSAVEIDAAGKKIANQQNCQVTSLAESAGGISFQRLDSALPFYPADAAGILKWAPILDELNNYQLKISGLKPGRYEIKTGGVKIAEHSAEELSTGVNLAAAALAAGPVAEQVKQVVAAIQQKNQFHHDRIFRGIVLFNFGGFPDWLGVNITPEEINKKRKAALAERYAALPELDNTIRQSLQIKPHLVEVVPVAK